MDSTFLKRSHWLLVLLSVAFFSAGCSTPNAGNQNANATAANQSSAENSASDNLGELMSLIRFPEMPDEKEIMWKKETITKKGASANGEASDQKLVVVLKYDDQTTARLLAQIEKHKAPEQVEIESENWFPEELTAQAQMSGNETLKGTAYGANDFVNAPYGTGRIVRIEGTNYFVLELFAV